MPLLPAPEPGVSQPKCGHMTTGTPRRVERMEGRQFLALVAGEGPGQDAPLPGEGALRGVGAAPGVPLARKCVS